MRNILTVFTIAVMVLTAGSAFAQYTGPWTYQWDFDSGLQGWTIGSTGGSWQAPGVEPTLPDEAPSGSKTGDKAWHGGTVYLPDKTYATIDVTSLNLGAGRNGFVLQADVYIPNLRPLGGFHFDYPGNANHQAGVGAINMSDGKMLVVEGSGNVSGSPDGAAGRVRDFTWDNNWHGPSWTIEESVSPDTLWWDKWITLQVDYGFTTPGKFSAWAYIPWSGPLHTAGWVNLATDIDVHPGGNHFGILQIGGTASWTQAEFDNVRLAVVPEPSSILALASGLAGMAGFVIRRRK